MSSSSLASFCMLETGKLFYEILEKARAGTLDNYTISSPLAKVRKPGAILDLRMYKGLWSQCNYQ